MRVQHTVICKPKPLPRSCIVIVAAAVGSITTVATLTTGCATGITIYNIVAAVVAVVGVDFVIVMIAVGICIYNFVWWCGRGSGRGGRGGRGGNGGCWLIRTTRHDNTLHTSNCCVPTKKKQFIFIFLVFALRLSSRHYFTLLYSSHSPLIVTYPYFCHHIYVGSLSLNLQISLRQF